VLIRAAKVIVDCICVCILVGVVNLTLIFVGIGAYNGVIFDCIRVFVAIRAERLIVVIKVDFILVCDDIRDWIFVGVINRTINRVGVALRLERNTVVIIALRIRVAVASLVDRPTAVVTLDFILVCDDIRDWIFVGVVIALRIRVGTAMRIANVVGFIGTSVACTVSRVLLPLWNKAFIHAGERTMFEILKSSICPKRYSLAMMWARSPSLKLLPQPLGICADEPRSVASRYNRVVVPSHVTVILCHWFCVIFTELVIEGVPCQLVPLPIKTEMFPLVVMRLRETVKDV